jgi:hypothetical protein
MVCAAIHFGLCCYYLRSSTYVFVVGLVSDGGIFVAASLGVLAAKRTEVITAKCYLISTVAVALFTVAFVTLEMFALPGESRSPASYLNGRVLKQLVGGLFASVIVVVVFVVSCCCYVGCASKLYSARQEALKSRQRLDSVTQYVMQQL